MRLVTLLGTIHTPIGRANSSELRAILESFAPEVIFMEMPPDAFDKHFQIFRRSNLESEAVSQYRQGRRVAVVPVDLQTPSDEFFSDYAKLHEKAKAENSRFKELLTHDDDNVSTHGFAYLNSDHNDQFWVEAYSEMEATLRRLRDPELDRIYEAWTTTNERREDAMLENIALYCSRYQFGAAAFLIGAAHRGKMIEKCNVATRNDQAQVEWNFPTL